jgi:hypothetical protein
MVAFTYRMDVGFAGTTNRNHDSTVVAETIDTANAPTQYGEAVMIDANGIRKPTAADTALQPWGFFVRPWVTQGGGVTTPTNDQLGHSTPPNSGVASVQKRGFMTVLLSGGGPVVKGGTIYVGTVGAQAGLVYGTAAAAGATPITLDSKSYFNGPADAKGITEIAVNL